MIRLGDQVEVLDDTITGKVVQLSSEFVTIEDQDGFRFEVSKTEVVPIKPLDIQINADDVRDKIKTDLNLGKTKSSQKSVRDVPIIEIDLHIHELVNNVKNMSNFDMLNLQLDTARHRLEQAIKSRHKRLVFIHGVGEGVLKQELETLFRRYDHIDFYDADFKTYGYGATEVYIYQS
ncbi:Smr/MutS family protein [Psychroflexus sp. ALD_RP9]|uniref:Smr/MutS family protein n=1 Tax=Psychroflexus sp. ALD_RP9 TaxID=2777186 RepID=UPI001A8E2A92|nr:Smr/MutS family protein [Psychroflexus sp. ALD_RP9]QSS97495.1 Smr/MutS family protein [Psychroflexus sp. ALD_RP9]